MNYISNLALFGMGAMICLQAAANFIKEVLK